MSRILQLKISLKYLKPLIWRRFLVKDSISFYELHEIIQIVMGWEDYHLYGFWINDVCIEAEKGRPFCVDAIWTMLGSEARKTKSADKVKLNSLIKKEKQEFTYVYDFGDRWEHSIVVEKILEKSERCPVCIAGGRACPPEDCGGVLGYVQLLDIRKDKNHPAYKSRIVEWLGEDFDPDEFDPKDVNG